MPSDRSARQRILDEPGSTAPARVHPRAFFDALRRCRQDEIKKSEKAVQTLTDQYTKLVDNAMDAKEKEVMQL